MKEKHLIGRLRFGANTDSYSSYSSFTVLLFPFHLYLVIRVEGMRYEEILAIRYRLLWVMV
jgi:hypothetical protein